MKQICSIFLALLITLACFPITVFADTGKVHGYSRNNYVHRTEYYYDDAYFLGSASDYNPSLATMSQIMAMSGFADNHSGTDVNYCDFRNLMHAIGFSDVQANADYDLPAETDTFAAVVAHKTITVDDAPCTLLAVTGRGANYSAEWAGNFTLGSHDDHSGFAAAGDKVIALLQEYISTYSSSFAPRIKLWMSGFSRAAAAINLAAAQITHDGEVSGLSIDSEDIFAYCFACPQGTHLDVTTPEEAASYTNIHNINNPGDLVPRVAMKDWGFFRYGTAESVIPDYLTCDDKALFDGVTEIVRQLGSKSADNIVPVTHSDGSESLTHILTTFQSKSLNPAYLIDHSQSPTRNTNVPVTVFYDQLLTTLCHGIGSRQNYAAKLQSAFRLIIAETKGSHFESAKWIQLCDVYGRILDAHSSRLILASLLGRKAFTHLAMQYFYQGMEQVGLNRADYASLPDAALEALEDVARALVSSLIRTGGSDLLTLASNMDVVTAGHEPDLYLAWLMALDPNYTSNAQPRSFTDSYRVVHVNGEADVCVYNDSGDTVAQITDGLVRDLPDSTIVSTNSADGEKLIYLPADSSYQLDVTPTADGLLSYSIDEYDRTVQAFTRTVAYTDLDTSEGEVLQGEVSRATQQESPDYSLSDGDTSITPTLDVSGEEAAACLIRVVSDNEDYGTVTGGGSYAHSAYAQLTAAALPGHAFVGWYQDDKCLSTEAIYRFCVEKDAEIRAVFAPSDEPVDATEVDLAAPDNEMDTLTIGADTGELLSEAGAAPVSSPGYTVPMVCMAVIAVGMVARIVYSRRKYS